MQQLLFKKLFLRSCLFTVLGVIVFTNTAKAGLDYYEIFIGKALVYKRYLNEPLNVKNLPLTQANTNEMLVINYYQCNAPNKLATKRSITLKDENGNIVKEWKFADANTSNVGMEIPVKELLQLQKSSKSSKLSFFYAAQGKNEGQKIASIAGGTGSVGYIHKGKNIFADDVTTIKQVCYITSATIMHLLPLHLYYVYNS